MQEPQDVTRMLADVGDGNRETADRLLAAVYDELRVLANGYLRRERGDHTLQATALVHEAFIRLVNQRDVQWQNRAHFFAVAAQAIRRLLVDHARARGREKRGGDWKKVPLDQVAVVSSDHDFDLLALDDGLTRLAEHDARKAQVVEMRFFAGLGLEEIAAVLGVTSRTVGADWQYARAWLFRELAGDRERSTRGDHGAS